MTITVIHGDSREKLRDLADASVDAVVTDPPYALVSITKRWSGDGPPPREGVYRRSTAGFMGKQWDTGETAFDPAFWVEVLRVMKPGAHLIAFGGTRTYHRLVCAIEDAGFEIRDQLAWLFGSGFPKSHDVSKGIDKLRRRDFVQAALDLGVELPGNSLHDWTKAEHAPGDKWWDAFKAAIPADKWAAIERAVVGTAYRVRRGSVVQIAGHSDGEYDLTAPATPEAAQWQGWGSALKPAHEPIVLARKPLIGTIAANVLKHGTGALNIDACRVEHSEECKPMVAQDMAKREGRIIRQAVRDKDTTELKPGGRWPANVIHDGSPEVLAGFPETQGQIGGNNDPNGSLGYHGGGKGISRPGVADSGSAARFFYTAKADKQDRLQSKHPTVKPVDLMAYLIKLVTPPGGLVLDPFAGSGTTGMAAMREGFDCVLIEREAEYVADIKRRLDHVHGADTPLFALEPSNV